MSDFTIRALRRIEFPTREGYTRFEVGDTLPPGEHSMTLVRIGLAEEVHPALAEAAAGAPLPADPGEWPGAVSLMPPPVDLDDTLPLLSDDDIDALDADQLRVEVALRGIDTPNRRQETLRAALREAMSRYTVQDGADAQTTEETRNG